MIDPKQAKEIRKRFASAQLIHITSLGIDAVSVANRDLPKAAAYFDNQNPLWPPGTCQSSFMPLWMSRRTWYVIRSSVSKPKPRQRRAP